MANDRWSDIAYPWKATLIDFVTPKPDVDVLKTSIINILLTRKGERVMRPTFGSDISDMVFELNDDILLAVLGEAVREAIEMWDDRIEFVDFNAERNEHTIETKILIRNATDPLRNAMSTIDINFTPVNVEVVGLTAGG